MRKQRTIRLDIAGRDEAPDVGDVLISDTRWYLVVDCEMKRKYLHCLRLPSAVTASGSTR